MACLTTSTLACEFPFSRDVIDNSQSTLEKKDGTFNASKIPRQEVLTHRVPAPYKIINIASHQRIVDVPIIIALISIQKSGKNPSSNDRRTYKGFSELTH